MGNESSPMVNQPAIIWVTHDRYIIGICTLHAGWIECLYGISATRAHSRDFNPKYGISKRALPSKLWIPSVRVMDVAETFLTEEDIVKIWDGALVSNLREVTEENDE